MFHKRITLLLEVKIARAFFREFESFQFFSFSILGTADNKVHIYELKGSVLTRDLQLTHLGPVTDVSYSPDDKYLVACDANRKVILYSVPEYKVSFVSFLNLPLKKCYTLKSVFVSF